MDNTGKCSDLTRCVDEPRQMPPLLSRAEIIAEKAWTQLRNISVLKSLILNVESKKKVDEAECQNNSERTLETFLDETNYVLDRIEAELAVLIVAVSG